MLRACLHALLCLQLLARRGSDAVALGRLEVRRHELLSRLGTALYTACKIIITGLDFLTTSELQRGSPETDMKRLARVSTP